MLKKQNNIGQKSVLLVHVYIHIIGIVLRLFYDIIIIARKFIYCVLF